MNIAIVASKYFPAVGGLEIAVNNIVQQFEKEGFDITLITNRYARKLQSKEIVNGKMVRRIFFTDRYPRSKNLWIWYKYGVGLLISPWSFWELIRVLRTKRVDIVHLHFVGSPSLYVLAAKKLLGFKLVVSIHGSDVELFPLKSDYQQWLLRATCRSSDFITSNSVHLLNKAFKMTGTEYYDKACVVPMGFPAEDYDGDCQAYRHSAPFLFAAGRFIYKKGFDVLIKAFARILKENEYEGDLIIAGEGDEFDRCRKLAETCGVAKRVHFFGFADRRQMASLMKGCDLFIAPSRLEAFGIVVLEALYAGKRVVATRAGGITETMEENPHQLVDPDDPAGLADKIVATLNDGHWNPVSALDIRRKYSWEAVVQSYLKIYRTLLHSGTNG